MNNQSWFPQTPELEAQRRQFWLLLFTVLLLGLFLNLLASIIFERLRQSISLSTLGVGTALASLLVFCIAVRSWVLAGSSRVIEFATGLVYDSENDSLLIPRVYRAAQIEMGAFRPPLPIIPTAKYAHLIRDLDIDQDWDERTTVLCELFEYIILKWMGAPPFLWLTDAWYVKPRVFAFGYGEDKPYDTLYVSDILAGSQTPNRFLQAKVSQTDAKERVLMMVPSGTTFQSKGRDGDRQLALEHKLYSLNVHIRCAGGQTFYNLPAQWDRTFDCPVDDAYLYEFLITLSFNFKGRLLKVAPRALHKFMALPRAEHIYKWVENVFSGLATYLDWMYDEASCPPQDRALLVGTTEEMWEFEVHRPGLEPMRVAFPRTSPDAAT